MVITVIIINNIVINIAIIFVTFTFTICIRSTASTQGTHMTLLSSSAPTLHYQHAFMVTHHKLDDDRQSITIRMTQSQIVSWYQSRSEVKVAKFNDFTIGREDSSLRSRVSCKVSLSETVAGKIPVLGHFFAKVLVLAQAIGAINIFMILISVRILRTPPDRHSDWSVTASYAIAFLWPSFAFGLIALS